MKDPIPRNTYKRESVPLVFPEDEGRTMQNHKNECDVNQIIKKFTRRSLEEYNRGFADNYGDLSGFDYQEAQFQIAQANSLYEQLPSAIRMKFDGPGDYLAFVENPDNEAELRKLGILPKKPEKQPEPDKPPKDTKADQEPSESAKTETEANKGATDKK